MIVAVILALMTIAVILLTCLVFRMDTEIRNLKDWRLKHKFTTHHADHLIALDRYEEDHITRDF